MAKKIAIGVAVVFLLLLVVAGVGLYWLFSSLDTLVAGGIQRFGSEALGAPVKVESVELALFEGRGSIRGLSIANPEGFSSGDALAFRELTVQLDPASAGGSQIQISQVRLIGPRVRVESLPDGTTNLDVLRRNAEAYAPSQRESAPPETPTGEPLRLSIGTLELQEASVSAAMGERERELSIPGFELEQLGGPEGAEPGALAKEVARKLTQQLTASLARAEVERAVGEQIDRALEDSGAGEVVRDALRSFGLPGGGSDEPEAASP